MYHYNVTSGKEGYHNTEKVTTIEQIRENQEWHWRSHNLKGCSTSTWMWLHCARMVQSSLANYLKELDVRRWCWIYMTITLTSWCPRTNVFSVVLCLQFSGICLHCFQCHCIYRTQRYRQWRPQRTHWRNDEVFERNPRCSLFFSNEKWIATSKDSTRSSHHGMTKNLRLLVTPRLTTPMTMRTEMIIIKTKLMWRNELSL